MANGNNLVVDCDTMIIPLKEQYAPSLPLGNLFDSDTMFDERNVQYKDIIKPMEDKDKSGNMGLYAKNPKYGMTILFNMSDQACDDEILQMMLDEVENIDKFKKIYITEDSWIIFF